MIYLTRRAGFSASHYYHNPDLSPEENRRIFGKCNNPHGHGHNYTLEVTVAGEINPTTGMVLDLKDLKKLLEREVLEISEDERRRFGRDLHDGLGQQLTALEMMSHSLARELKTTSPGLQWQIWPR